MALGVGDSDELADRRLGRSAAIESWVSTLKFELGDTFESAAEAKAELFDYIDVFYNQERRHSFTGRHL